MSKAEFFKINNINPATYYYWFKKIKTQEKILSKLLDAQRSVNERDFEKNRESFSGKEFKIKSPDELILSNEQSINILREELLKSIQDGYSKDYEELIRRYFESLNQTTN